MVISPVDVLLCNDPQELPILINNGEQVLVVEEYLVEGILGSFLWRYNGEVSPHEPFHRELLNRRRFPKYVGHAYDAHNVPFVVDNGKEVVAR